MTSEIKVLIVDDHGVVRQGLRTYLDLIDCMSSDLLGHKSIFQIETFHLIS